LYQRNETKQALCKNINLSGYNGKNSTTRAGGVGIYVVDSMKCNEVTKLSMNVSGCEDMWFEVAINSKTVLLVGTVYRHPGHYFNNFQLAFENNLKILTL